MNEQKPGWGPAIGTTIVSNLIAGAISGIILLVGIFLIAITAGLSFSEAHSSKGGVMILILLVIGVLFLIPLSILIAAWLYQKFLSVFTSSEYTISFGKAFLASLAGIVGSLVGGMLDLLVAGASLGLASMAGAGIASAFVLREFSIPKGAAPQAFQNQRPITLAGETQPTYLSPPPSPSPAPEKPIDIDEEWDGPTPPTSPTV